jgi:hypothetical protein
LHGRTPSNFDLWPDLSQSAYATLEGFECTAHPPNLIVNLGRAIHRDDDVIHRLCYRRALRFQEQTGGEQGEPHAESSKQAAERGKISVHLRFAPGKHNPPDLQSSQGLDVSLKVLDGNLPDLTDPPDVTHHAAAIATIVREQNEDRQRANVRIES